MSIKSFILAAALLPATAFADINIQRWHTPQGTQVLLVERHENPIVDVEISFKGAGSVFNPDSSTQTAEFTAALLTDGTKSLDEEAFNRRSNDIAADIASSSGQETATVSLRSLSQRTNLTAALALLNESLTAPRFDAAVFARRKQQAVTALKQRETTPDFTAERMFTRLIYPYHPYGNSANITVAGLEKVSLDDIRAFHRSRYAKNNAVIAIVGDVTRIQAEKLAATALNGLPDTAQTDSRIAPVDKPQARTSEMPFAGEQAHIVLGMPLIQRNDPDYYALVAGNYILGGGGFDSRLMKKLRDEKGYTYGVYSILEPASQAGPLRIEYSTQKKNARASLANARSVIETFIAQGPTEEELKQAKANIVGGFPLRFDSNAKLVKYLSLIGVYNLPDDYLQRYPEAVSKLTVQQIKDAWRRRVNLSDFSTVVVGTE
nr:pitrilysin family protein [Neisseria lisongii]